MTEQAQPIFSIEKLFVSDLSLEVPNAPQVFLEQASPDIDVRVATRAQKLEENFFTVDLTVTVTAKLAEDRVMFLSEVNQSGIFHLENFQEDDLQIILAVACPNILFPYAREVLSSTITKAGFPPVLLAPINFEAMYQQQLGQEEQESGNA